MKSIKTLVALLCIASLIGCSNQTTTKKITPIEDKKIKNFNISKTFSEDVRTCYSLFPISFADSNNDGYGDLKGIENKLDYLRDLGIQCIYLNPIHPSPSYHKYDVIDYYAIDPKFGTMNDFENLLSFRCVEHFYVQIIFKQKIDFFKIKSRFSGFFYLAF